VSFRVIEAMTNGAPVVDNGGPAVGTREVTPMPILIAEDNVAQRRYLRELLEREFPSHSPVLEAGDGETTVELALEHRPELCVLDIQMPKLSGVKAARAIWRGFP